MRKPFGRCYYKLTFSPTFLKAHIFLKGSAPGISSHVPSDAGVLQLLLWGLAGPPLHLTSGPCSIHQSPQPPRRAGTRMTWTLPSQGCPALCCHWCPFSGLKFPPATCLPGKTLPIHRASAQMLCPMEALPESPRQR